MFTNGGFHGQIGNNSVKSEQILHPPDNKHSHINQETKIHQSPSATASFIKRFNPFSKSKSQTINSNIDCVTNESLNDKEFTSVKVLKQFWTAKSIEHLNQKSATIKYFSQSNDSLNDPKPSRVEKSLTLDGRLPLDEFNKFKDADFVRNKKNRLKYFTQTNCVAKKFSRPESFLPNDNHYPQVSAIGGKIHWATREDILTKKVIGEDEMSTKSSKNHKSNHEKKDSMSSSIGSFNSSITSTSTSTANTNSANRKFSFKTAPSTTASYMNKKIAANNNGNKVAQIAQRFNQMIQQDATILDEVKKRGTVVLHRSGGCVYKIKEEKVDNKPPSSHKKSNDDASDDALSLISIGKNSTRKKSSLKKRPSIRILIESPRKEGKSGNVLSKKQMYETNIVNKETIVLKPKVPDKSERVLAKTIELKNKKLIELKETDKKSTLSETKLEVKINETPENLIIDRIQSPTKDHKKNNFQKIYDKISFRPTFLYGKKASKLETTLEVCAKPAEAPSNKQHDDISKEAEDELEFQPIDLNLNVYFNKENLSANPKDSFEGSFNDVATASEGKLDQSVKTPNESFLFRTHSGGKFGSASDVFFHEKLIFDARNDENIAVIESLPSTIKSNDDKCSSNQDNGYEIISKGLLGELMNSERADIDQNNSSSEENIYQSLCEVKGDTESVKSYESFENYDEIKQNILDNKINLSDLLKCEDDYIFPEKAPEPPPPRKNTIPRISSPILTSSTSNLVQPELQMPKLKNNYELHKSNSCVSTTYEKIKYDQLPIIKLPLPPRNDGKLPYDDENIYDTIKSGVDNRLMIKIPDKNKSDVMIIPSGDDDSFDNFENPYKNPKNDTMSIISNCYESISLKQNYSTINQILRHAISTSTLSSEHRINSIYGTMVGQSLTPPSDRSASDNSDEWIDLSDEENDGENVTDNRFIV